LGKAKADPTKAKDKRTTSIKPRRKRPTKLVSFTPPPKKGRPKGSKDKKVPSVLQAIIDKRVADLTDGTPKPILSRASSDHGRHEKLEEGELLHRARVHANAYRQARMRAGRDIAPIPTDEINWERRKACRRNLKLFSETYLPRVFKLAWSDDQLRCVAKEQSVILDGGKFCMAQPRGGGKTAICRSGLLWASAYAHRRFMFFLGSKEQKAAQTLDFVRQYWYRSDLLRQDFPEIAWAVYKLENRWQLAKGQLYMDEPTYIEWGTNRIRFPSLILPKEIADEYEANDSECLLWVPEIKAFVHKTAGIILGTNGIDGSIRGEAEVHPITLEQPRPDLVLLDDVQKDQKADSPVACERLVRLIDGAIQGLGGPGEEIAALMPCTVIREGDVADTYLDHIRKPEWRGERCAMVKSWPPGITDTEITNDTEPGKLWNEYAELRRRSLKVFQDMRLCTEFYGEHREVMDRGFVVSWTERYIRKGPNVELSAQQHSMNLRLEAPTSFLAEYQNIGRKLHAEGSILITASQLAEKKVIPVPEFDLPLETEHVTAFIDVQNEILFYLVLGVSPDFDGFITTYGTWPEVNVPYFQKYQAEGWSLITRAFFNRYPEHQDKALLTSDGKRRAPLEAKIFFALQECTKHLLSMRFRRRGQHPKTFEVDKLGIDTRWGMASEAIKRFIREQGTNRIVPCYGQSFPPTKKQLEEYERRPDWTFENTLCPNVREDKWVIRPNPDGMYYLNNDVDRLKDFVFARLATPPGAKGSISLYHAPAERHEMFSHHICSSEYPEAVTARMMTKNMWQVREVSTFDNDWLDCLVGCCALAGTRGASYKTPEGMPQASHRKLSDVFRRKRA